MDLEFRDTRITDVDALFEVRANTRQNPFSRVALAELGITPESTSAGERTANGDEILELVF